MYEDAVTGEDLKEFTSFGAEVDLQTSSNLGGVCRRLIVTDAGSGTKVVGVKVAKGAVSRTFTAFTGMVIDCEITHLLTSTTVTSVVAIR